MQRDGTIPMRWSFRPAAVTSLESLIHVLRPRPERVGTARHTGAAHGAVPPLPLRLRKRAVPTPAPGSSSCNPARRIWRLSLAALSTPCPPRSSAGPSGPARGSKRPSLSAAAPQPPRAPPGVAPPGQPRRAEPRRSDLRAPRPTEGGGRPLAAARCPQRCRGRSKPLLEALLPRVTSRRSPREEPHGGSLPAAPPRYAARSVCLYVPLRAQPPLTRPLYVNVLCAAAMSEDIPCPPVRPAPFHFHVVQLGGEPALLGKPEHEAQLDHMYNL